MHGPRRPAIEEGRGGKRGWWFGDGMLMIPSGVFPWRREEGRREGGGGVKDEGRMKGGIPRLTGREEGGGGRERSLLTIT